MKFIPFLAVLLIVSSLGELGAQTPAATAGTQTLCPIMGNKIDPAVSTVYEGKKIYFCCPGCIPTFNKTPQALIDKMENGGVILETVAPTGAVPPPARQAASGSSPAHPVAGQPASGSSHDHSRATSSGSTSAAPDPHPSSSSSSDAHGCGGGGCGGGH